MDGSDASKDLLNRLYPESNGEAINSRHGPGTHRAERLLGPTEKEAAEKSRRPRTSTRTSWASAKWVGRNRR